VSSGRCYHAITSIRWRGRSLVESWLSCSVFSGWTSKHVYLAIWIWPQESSQKKASYLAVKWGNLFKGIEGTARFDATELEAIIKAMVAARRGTQDAPLEIKSQVAVPSAASPRRTKVNFAIFAVTTFHGNPEPAILYSRLLWQLLPRRFIFH